jgi:arylsulfatase
MQSSAPIGKGATGTLFVDGQQVAEEQIPQTIRVVSRSTRPSMLARTPARRWSRTCRQVAFAFTGTLKKFVVILEPEKLTPEERKALRDEEAKAVMAVDWAKRPTQLRRAGS